MMLHREGEPIALALVLVSIYPVKLTGDKNSREKEQRKHSNGYK